MKDDFYAFSKFTKNSKVYYLLKYGAGSLYSTIKKWHLNIFQHLKKSRYRKNKPVTLFSKTCSIELLASFLIYTLLKKLLAFKIALFLYDRPFLKHIKSRAHFDWF